MIHFFDLSEYSYFKIDESGDNFENNLKFKYEVYVKNHAYNEELKAIEELEMKVNEKILDLKKIE